MNGINEVNEQLIAKWKPLLEHEDLPKIGDAHKRYVTAVLLENTEKAIRENGGANPQGLFEVATNSVGTGGYGASGGTPFQGYTQKDWNQTLITKINQISAQIHKTTLRGGANWIVVSSEVSAVFDDLEYFHVSNAAPEQDSYNMGIEKIGSLAGRYQVYRDPYFPAGVS